MPLTSPLPPMFIQVPDVTPTRVLHACQQLEPVDGKLQLCTTESFESVSTDSTLLLYFEERQTFMQQPARVRALEPGPDEVGTLLTLERLGEAINAEQRQVYRVSCVNVPIHASMDRESDCPVVDVSATGFGVRCKSKFSTGQLVTAVLSWDGEGLKGTVAIVSERSLTDGMNRYGVRCVDSGNNTRGMNLKRSLTRISLAVQREQMRRVQ
ncbi:MAG: PilZ domain-containing protein [Myxococcota bacterium]